MWLPWREGSNDSFAFFSAFKNYPILVLYFTIKHASGFPMYFLWQMYVHEVVCVFFLLFLFLYLKKLF